MSKPIDRSIPPTMRTQVFAVTATATALFVIEQLLLALLPLVAE